MPKNLVIVESPAKAKTLKKFLGANYKIEASMGHVRDLPKSELGIDTENDFEPRYITIRGKGDLLKKLRKEVKAAEKIYLATDPDREGEAISWHLCHALSLDGKETYRITFNEITKNAVKKSIKEAREIDMNLVDAQQARRALDRVVGYKISPLLWKKVKKGLSAGRVQSVLLKMICDREEEIANFVPKEFWTLEAALTRDGKKQIAAKYYGNPEKAELNTKQDVDKIIDEISSGTFKVTEVKKGKRTKKPLPPFTTSTMQQEASKNLNFTAVKTMSVAQQLYEGVDITGQGTIGLVSYIRTDSTRISDEAFAEAKTYITETYGVEFANPEKSEHKNSGRSQDAHEAIRPTYVNLTPASIKDSLTKEQLKLYTLVWERFVAAQMMPALYDTVSVSIGINGHVFRASGSTLKFAGYKTVYKRDEEEKEPLLPEINEGDILMQSELKPEQHFTQPPARFSEAMLVRTLEENGVGRPSTYAPTIATITARGYVTKENKAFFPTELGEAVNEILCNNFGDIVDAEFTSRMENQLDGVEDGDVEWKEVLRKFYPDFAEKVKEAEEKVSEVEIKDLESDVICNICGRRMVIKMGRYGKFLACPGFPECRNTLPLFEDAGVSCPKCGAKVIIKKSKKGRKFFVCENSENCDFISWSKPTGENCPTCGSFLVEKGSKGVVSCSDAKCGYRCEKENNDEKEE